MEKYFDADYEPASPSTHDLVNKLSIILGHCDLLRDQLKAGSPSANRVCAIQEVVRGMAMELNEYQCQLAEWTRSAGVQKQRVT